MSDGAGTEIVVVAVKAGSRKGPLVDVAVEAGQPWTVYVREPAVEGKANRAVRRVLAEHFGVPPSRVTLVAGATARIKRFRVERG
ncbi:DUF167 domain-containing protein [Mycobacterium koreense]|uniref:Uncharacterized protein n=1 Tax=Mycolicibacillus koreensis TaxID=1069220 RepID=A0A7I7SA39_9MYCO|nr:DUF167 domain-containing protein [Mycolicibacillus koreensis]MCV7248814.1 DUF167 domain-containing protein [Mycolicibacillus koreensis]ODR08310.1 hypothetical protein BHQ15_09415 [Mycolicibacillus koreensis]OSC36068.1 hypothetical protein B8W67_00840 [Mycolicibacillus koreensis]BBY53658.1 UPF0235 protein [Mycolicibacillus koreensis]